MIVIIRTTLISDFITMIKIRILTQDLTMMIMIKF